MSRLASRWRDLQRAGSRSQVSDTWGIIVNKKMVTATLALCGAISFNTAGAMVITFNGLGGTDMVGNSNVVPGRYTSFDAGRPAIVDGFNFISTNIIQQHNVLSPHWSATHYGDTSGFAFNGTDYWMGYPITGSPLTMSQVGGGAFTLDSFDMVSWVDGHYGYGGTATDTVTITGNLSGGGSISQTLSLFYGQYHNSSTQVGNDFTTYSMAGFNNLSSVTISPGYLPYLAMDNFNVSTVAAIPEPSIYALMLAGLAALGIATRRPKAAAVSV